MVFSRSSAQVEARVGKIKRDTAYQNRIERNKLTSARISAVGSRIQMCPEV